jgi:hypothetical protein
MTTRAKKKKNWRGKKNVGFVVVVLYPINMSCRDEQYTSASPLFSPSPLPISLKKGETKRKKKIWDM